MLNKLVRTILLASTVMLLGCQPSLTDRVAGAQVAAENSSKDSADTKDDWGWQTLSVKGKPVARHEAGLVGLNEKIYLLGGRRINPTSVFDIETNTWTDKSPTPIELHHFQPVVHENKIYIIGALTGGWPNENPVDKVIIYDPLKDLYEYSHAIPTHRLRGGAGAVSHNGKIYIVGGIIKGHMEGYVSWVDEYDPATGHWKALPDAPIARDHFQLAIADSKLYAFAGRKTSKATGEDMELTVEHGNVYDLNKGKWLEVTSAYEIPTKRAGNSAIAWQNKIIVGGGESASQVEAHNEIDVFDTKTLKWSTWPSLERGRHGTGFVISGDYLYTVSGAGNRGGGPELTSMERLKLTNSEANAKNLIPKSHPTKESLLVTKKWHTLTLNFNGPQVAETDTNNPFLNYKLLVEFWHKDSKTRLTLPGYFAADGNAANTSADKGHVWQVKFNPDQLGEWSYDAVLYAGENVAISDDLFSGLHKQTKLKVDTFQGRFLVIPSDKQGVNFKANGRLTTDSGYFRFANEGKYWLKGGTNSPENLLGYKDFDGTYRVKAAAREGEAAPVEALHHYSKHLQDWRSGDPTWQDGKGKSLIGAINYLADQGMNSSYFLTMNILGDGKDVWPYLSHEAFDRFDVSKLAQWEIVFEHMQNKGILLHMVIQETENETMLDGGDTGKQRQLYFNELIARFGHHLGLIWNLGEENGYAKWSPNAQNTEQRKAMASYLKANDPLQHPVFLHTHSHDPDRENILTPLLGFKDIDGLSLQVDKREQVAEVIKRWRNSSRESGHQWAITMDEIGMWHTAALPDSVDPTHDSLRRHALWGSLLAGGAGVEWYFGAKHPHNDLTSEDWRQRHQLWQQTEVARSFFDKHLSYEKTEPCLNKSAGAADSLPWIHCANLGNEAYVYYFVEGLSFQRKAVTESGKQQAYDILWYNPITGGELQTGSKEKVGTGEFDLGQPPVEVSDDWVVLLKPATVQK